MTTKQVPQIDTHLATAVLVSLFCFFPTGLYAIICAARVEGYLMAGRIEEAKAQANEARKWNTISIVLGAMVIMIYIFALLYKIST